MKQIYFHEDEIRVLVQAVTRHAKAMDQEGFVTDVKIAWRLREKFLLELKQ